MKLVKTALAIAIAVVFVIFIAYGLYAVYEPPRYESGSNECIKEFDCYKYISHCDIEKPIDMNEKPIDMDERIIDRDCYSNAYESEEYINCQTNFENCMSEYSKTTERYRNARNSFYILLAIGLIAIVIGIFLKYDSIGSGLIGGGVLVIIWSLIYTSRYWIMLNKYIKLVALGLVLIILIYLGYKKIEKNIK